MQKKLTLRLDEELIARAKAHAQKTGRSVSQMVGDYFALLESRPGVTRATLPPVVQGLRGLLADADAREEDYHQHLEEKHQ
jgi:hypothetical protein